MAVEVGSPRSEPLRVPPRHRAWTHCYRLWLGRAFLLLLLASRAVVWTVGCAPAAGSEGGQCISSDGCSSGYCNDGLQCDNQTNTCFASPPPGPPGPPPSVCNAVSSGASCDNAASFSCYGDASPNRVCDAQPTDDAGTRCSAAYRRAWLKLHCLPVRIPLSRTPATILSLRRAWTRRRPASRSRHPPRVICIVARRQTPVLPH
jgi:hypothetical protein